MGGDDPESQFFVGGNCVDVIAIDPEGHETAIRFNGKRDRLINELSANPTPLKQGLDVKLIETRLVALNKHMGETDKLFSGVGPKERIP